MQLQLLSENKLPISFIDASDKFFTKAYNEALVHQIVTAYQANGRQGTRAQLDRANVDHSTKKPWRQKGTGRARAGMSSSPLWRGGGKAFPSNSDENFSQKINKKMYRAGVSSIYSQLIRENRLQVLDSLDVSTPKTKDLIQKIKSMGLSIDSLLIITDEISYNLHLASRNISTLSVILLNHANPVALLKYKNILLTQAVVRKLEEFV